MHIDLPAVAAANAAFYAAHEQRDLPAMTALWENTERVSCTHPGWPTLHGWDDVGESWHRIFLGPARNQFIITNEVIVIEGDVAWVTCDENVVHGGATGTIAATNIFIRRDDAWRMVVHHGSPLMG